MKYSGVDISFSEVLTEIWRKWFISYRFKVLTCWLIGTILSKSFSLFLYRNIRTSEPKTIWNKEHSWHLKSIKQNSFVLWVVSPLALSQRDKYQQDLFSQHGYSLRGQFRAARTSKTNIKYSSDCTASNKFSHTQFPFSATACPQAQLREKGIQALRVQKQQQPGSAGRKQLQSSHELETWCQLSISHLVVSEEVEETETAELTDYFHSLTQDVMRDLRNLDF